MTDEPRGTKPVSTRVVILLALVALFAGVLGAKALASRGASGAAGEVTRTQTITSARNDAFADYEAARTSGKPVYVLFHSMTCKPCIEISAVADRVVPEYANDVVFVNAITDDPSAQQLASKFAFQYIPTSFFVAADGTVSDSYTGPLSAEEMRARLDALVAE